MLASLLTVIVARATVTLAPSPSRTHTVYALGFGNRPVSIDLVSSITSTSPDVSLSLGGTPTGSGLVISPSGELSGTPTAQDLAAKQPLMLTVQASAADGSSVSFPVMLSLIASEPADYVAQFLYVGSPVDLDPPSFKTLAAPYSCSATGLPAGSGLQVDSTSCAISGTPNNADASANQPLLVTITATGQQSNDTATIVYILTIMEPSRTAGQSGLALTPSQTPTHLLYKLGVVGRAMNVNLSKEVEGSASFTLEGLPSGSGLSLSSDGILSGTPNAQDAAATQPQTLTVTATSSTDPTATVSFPLLLSVIADPKVPAMFMIFASEGSPVGLDMSKSFAALTKPVDYSATGIPQGSGLKFDAKTGVLSGSLTAADRQAKQPLQLMLTATSSEDQKNSTIDFIITVLPATTNAAAPSRPARSIALAPSDSRAYIVRKIALVGRAVNIGLNAFFTTDGGVPSSVKVEGLPLQSGLSVTTSSNSLYQLSGTPNANDAAHSQPLLLTVTAFAEDGSYASFPLYLAVLEESPANSMVLFVAQNLSLSGVDATNAYSPALNTLKSPLTFSVAGLPSGTGIIVDSQTGTISGSPNEADYATKRPLTITITATDADAKTAQAKLTLIVTPSADQAPTGTSSQNSGSNPTSSSTSTSSAPAQAGTPVPATPKPTGAGTPIPATPKPTGAGTSVPATPKPIGTPAPATPKPTVGTAGTTTTTPSLLPGTPVVVCAVGVQKTSVVSPSSIFPTLKGPITLSGVSGLPVGTGLSIAADGTVSGAPTAKDRQAKQPIAVSVTGTGAGGVKQQALVFVVVLAKPPTPIQVTGVAGKVRSPIKSVSALQSPNKPLKFTIAPAIPQGSGLKFDATKGVLSGTPTATDLAKQPQQFVITTTDSKGTVKRLAVVVPVVAANFPATS